MKPSQKFSKPTKNASPDQPSKRINLTVVSAEEREKYRVPTYGYILP